MAMGTIHIVAHILRTIVHHLTLCADSQNPSQLPCWHSTLEIYSPAALLLMSLSAHYKQIAQGVLSAEFQRSQIPDRWRNPDPTVAN